MSDYSIIVLFLLIVFGIAAIPGNIRMTWRKKKIYHYKNGDTMRFKDDYGDERLLLVLNITGYGFVELRDLETGKQYTTNNDWMEINKRWYHIV